MKKYYLIGTAILLVGLFAYHFVAENRAEEQITTAIQEEINKSGAGFSIQYSDLDISSFTGDIAFNDITLVRNNTILRSSHLLVDLSYWDFLRIYGGGLRFGLEYLSEADITLIRPSYVDRKTLFEIKFDTLALSYSGNALDLLRNINSKAPLSTSHQLAATSGNTTIAFPGTAFSRMKGNNFRYNFRLPNSTVDWISSGNHTMQVDSLTWTPSEDFQQTYSFFIKGFGYETDAIPFESADLAVDAGSEPNLLQLDASLSSELAKLSAFGKLELQEPLQSSRWQELEIAMGDFSPTFSNVMNNLERMLSVSLPQENGQIRIQLTGTLSDTQISEL